MKNYESGLGFNQNPAFLMPYNQNEIIEVKVQKQKVILTLVSITSAGKALYTTSQLKVCKTVNLYYAIFLKPVA
jgi:hypothetical protein